MTSLPGARRRAIVAQHFDNDLLHVDVQAVVTLGNASVSVGGNVTASGALVLADGPRRSRFLSGEISLRRA